MLIYWLKTYNFCVLGANELGLCALAIQLWQNVLDNERSDFNMRLIFPFQVLSNDALVKNLQKQLFASAKVRFKVFEATETS